MVGVEQQQSADIRLDRLGEHREPAAAEGAGQLVGVRELLGGLTSPLELGVRPLHLGHRLTKLVLEPPTVGDVGDDAADLERAVGPGPRRGAVVDPARDPVRAPQPVLNLAALAADQSRVEVVVGAAILGMDRRLPVLHLGVGLGAAEEAIGARALEQLPDGAVGLGGRDVDMLADDVEEGEEAIGGLRGARVRLGAAGHVADDPLDDEPAVRLADGPGSVADASRHPVEAHDAIDDLGLGARAQLRMEPVALPTVLWMDERAPESTELNVPRLGAADEAVDRGAGKTADVLAGGGELADVHELFEQIEHAGERGGVDRRRPRLLAGAAPGQPEVTEWHDRAISALQVSALTEPQPSGRLAGRRERRTVESRTVRSPGGTEMSDDETKDGAPAAKRDHEPPPGVEASLTWRAAGAVIDYTVSANWTVLRKDDKPAAEIFSVSYVADTEEDADGRPVTFIFNGGPGASSAYLQMGVVGPTRVAFSPDGTLPTMPPRLVENEDSWLGFSDLVFVDPVGTGFSRVIDPDDGTVRPGAESASDAKPGDAKPGGGDRAHEFFGYKRDLESLCEFVGRWMSRTRRWGSPVFIAGESYGGYRVGRLVRMLQETAGVGLSGAILISPALELGALSPGDYDALGWIDTLPTMALAAVHHGRSRAFEAGTSTDEVGREAEAFATGDYASFLARGASMPAADRERILERLADLTGLPLALVTRSEGRVSIHRFVRELLRDERRVLGLYDATITTVDPFPDRDSFEGADPTLAGFAPAFATAINRQLRREIGIETDREYIVLSHEVFQAWRNDAPEHFFVPPVGATDDFRYGMALNPHMRAFITHGRYDLVTPYYATDRLRNLMRLDPRVAERLTVRHFGGGHMFYAWEESRREFTTAIAAFVADALAG